MPAHIQALHAHQSRFGLRAGAEGRGSQIEIHETQTQKLIWQHRDDRIVAQLPCLTFLKSRASDHSRWTPNCTQYEVSPIKQNISYHSHNHGIMCLSVLILSN